MFGFGVAVAAGFLRFLVLTVLLLHVATVFEDWFMVFYGATAIFKSIGIVDGLQGNKKMNANT